MIRIVAGIVLFLVACATGVAPHNEDASLTDAASGVFYDAPSANRVDAATTTYVDAGVPNFMDAAPIPDAPPTMGVAQYLDPCTTPDECISGLCEMGIGSQSFCTRSCTVNSQCAHAIEFVFASLCVCRLGQAREPSCPTCKNHMNHDQHDFIQQVFW